MKDLIKKGHFNDCLPPRTVGINLLSLPKHPTKAPHQSQPLIPRTYNVNFANFVLFAQEGANGIESFGAYSKCQVSGLASKWRIKRGNGRLENSHKILVWVVFRGQSQSLIPYVPHYSFKNFQHFRKACSQ